MVPGAQSSGKCGCFAMCSLRVLVLMEEITSPPRHVAEGRRPEAGVESELQERSGPGTHHAAGPEHTRGSSPPEGPPWTPDTRVKGRGAGAEAQATCVCICDRCSQTCDRCACTHRNTGPAHAHACALCPPASRGGCSETHGSSGRSPILARSSSAPSCTPEPLTPW